MNSNLKNGLIAGSAFIGAAAALQIERLWSARRLEQRINRIRDTRDPDAPFADPDVEQRLSEMERSFLGIFADLQELQEWRSQHSNHHVPDFGEMQVKK